LQVVIVIKVINNKFRRNAQQQAVHVGGKGSTDHKVVVADTTIDIQHRQATVNGQAVFHFRQTTQRCQTQFEDGFAVNAYCIDLVAVQNQLTVTQAQTYTTAGVVATSRQIHRGLTLRGHASAFNHKATGWLLRHSRCSNRCCQSHTGQNFCNVHSYTPVKRTVIVIKRPRKKTTRTATSTQKTEPAHRIRKKYQTKKPLVIKRASSISNVWSPAATTPQSASA